MKILVISSYLPYPLFSGGNVRLFNLLKRLSLKNELTLICEKRETQSEKDVEEIKKICKKVLTVPRKKQWSIKNILKTGFSFYPFLMIGHSNSKMKDLIRNELMNNNFDLVHVETFYVMQNLPKNSVNIPVVLVEHNIEHKVYERFAKQASFYLRFPLYMDVWKMKIWEEYFWKKATKLIAVSEKEKEEMRIRDVEVVPNGVDIKKYQISNIKYQISKEEKTILFIGDFKWVQNRDSLEWILREIWPGVRSQFAVHSSQSRLRLWIVGKDIPQNLKNLIEDPDVIFDESAEDAVEIFQKADILLAPIRVGGGTSFKILEAMASGVPVVTTTLGNEGIMAKMGQEILIGNNPEEIVEKVKNILESEEIRKKIINSARVFIEEKYSWDIIANKLEEVYKSTIT